MKGRMIYIVISVMLAVTIGHTSTISAYTYDGNIASAYAQENYKRVSGMLEIVDYKQNVTKEVVNACQDRTEETLKELEPTEWEIWFEEEFTALDCKDTENIWQYFPTIQDDPTNEIAILCQIVEAEAGTEDLTGKMMVAEVILNRIKAGFGDSVAEVVFAQGQFDPVETGFYYMVNPSTSTMEAVYKAISEDDLSNGALYFGTRSVCYAYFSTFLTETVSHGSHVFFK